LGKEAAAERVSSGWKAEDLAYVSAGEYPLGGKGEKKESVTLEAVSLSPKKSMRLYRETIILVSVVKKRFAPRQ